MAVRDDELSQTSTALSIYFPCAALLTQWSYGLPYVRPPSPFLMCISRAPALFDPPYHQEYKLPAESPGRRGGPKVAEEERNGVEARLAQHGKTAAAQGNLECNVI